MPFPAGMRLAGEARPISRGRVGSWKRTAFWGSRSSCCTKAKDRPRQGIDGKRVAPFRTANAIDLKEERQLKRMRAPGDAPVLPGLRTPNRPPELHRSTALTPSQPLLYPSY